MSSLSISVLNASGKVVMHRGVVPLSICDQSFKALIDSGKPIPPLTEIESYFVAHIRRHDMFFLAIFGQEQSALLITEFLDRLVTIFDAFLGGVTEERISQKSHVIYQVVDEVLDGSLPMNTELNILKALIPTNTETSALPSESMSAISWRQNGVVHQSNEITFDVVEKLDVIVDANGMTAHSIVNGEILVNSKLSGMPDITISFDDPDILDNGKTNAASFHPCVRYRRFDENKTLSFVPPDGKFVLTSYMTTAHRQRMLPLYVKPVFGMGSSAGRCDISVGTKQALPLEDVVLTVPLPKGVAVTLVKPSVGTYKTDMASNTIVWTIGRILQTSKSVPSISIKMEATGSEPVTTKPVISVAFSIPNLSLSGLKIRRLDMSGETYKMFKGVKSMCKSGVVQFRT
ncbi:Adaptor Protein Complex 3 subunit, mu (AP3M) [Carpediemonas membranifera]|uniref:Adaptor Protein Complex 3 subunit, mu (AP3M) n=1 Tax=Carpediemonas membranifera TaxID=201153 RepID=A0A8J6AVR0_9EUKA|nr:Adaptor Protein Complex 3 subunit, mu (AP3M) [Carpediemonas membranifera]|eukprot:KAG9389433.1 Adaptor Protein Complex 3 subunit, mu (AP3M) [Carpediemonas membranifera]